MTGKRSLWDALPDLPLETGGVWDRIDKDAKSRESDSPSTDSSSWLELTYQPSGVWEDIDEETLLLRPEDLSLWPRLEQALSIAPPADESVWDEIDEETLLIRPDEADLWQETDDETLRLQSPATSVWQEMRPGDLTRYKPRRKQGWALKPLTDTHGRRYFILKNVSKGTYLRLSPEQRYIWDLLDGRHSVQDIAIAYLIEYKAFDISGLMAFFEQLGDQDLLVNPRADVYESVEETIAQHSWGHWLRTNIPRLLELEFDIKAIDTKITRLYLLVGPVLYHKVTLIVMFLLAISGLATFSYQSLITRYTPLRGGTQVPLWGLLGLYIVSAVVLLIHELSHALTCKHFRREVRRGGFMLYMGFPTWFVDTTDIWLSPRLARIWVSFAGPYSGLVLAGFCSLLVFAAPNKLIGGLLFQAAFSAYVLSLWNLNPLVKFDGYYILMDWLEIPRLRYRAIVFVTQGLWRKLRARQKLNDEERLFAIFGGLSLTWTLIALGLAVVIWGNRIWRFALGFALP